MTARVTATNTLVYLLRFTSMTCFGTIGWRDLKLGFIASPLRFFFQTAAWTAHQPVPRCPTLVLVHIFENQRHQEFTSITPAHPTQKICLHTPRFLSTSVNPPSVSAITNWLRSTHLQVDKHFGVFILFGLSRSPHSKHPRQMYDTCAWGRVRTQIGLPGILEANSRLSLLTTWRKSKLSVER